MRCYCGSTADFEVIIKGDKKYLCMTHAFDAVNNEWGNVYGWRRL